MTVRTKEARAASGRLISTISFCVRWSNTHNNDSVGVCADWRIPQKDDLCGYQRWQADVEGYRDAYSPSCVEGRFCEVRFKVFGGHIVLLITKMVMAAHTQMATRQTTNATPERRAYLSKGASVRALRSARRATLASMAATVAVERKLL
jgi:hypothetical protein